jgi:hypothetical protein
LRGERWRMRWRGDELDGETYPNLSLTADLLFNLFDANVFFAVVACSPHGV